MTARKQQPRRNPRRYQPWFYLSFQTGEGRDSWGNPTPETRWVFKAKSRSHALEMIRTSRELDEAVKKGDGRITNPTLAKGEMRRIGNGQRQFVAKEIESVADELKPRGGK